MLIVNFLNDWAHREKLHVAISKDKGGFSNYNCCIILSFMSENNADFVDHTAILYTYRKVLM